jgi:hypothetical protein
MLRPGWLFLRICESLSHPLLSWNDDTHHVLEACGLHDDAVFIVFVGRPLSAAFLRLAAAR